MKKLILAILLLTSLSAFSQVDSTKWKYVFDGNKSRFTMIENIVTIDGKDSGKIRIPIQMNYIYNFDSLKWKYVFNALVSRNTHIENIETIDGIDSGKIRIPIYGIIPEKTDTTYLTLRIDSLTNSALKISDFRNGDIIASDGAEFKPMSVDSIIRVHSDSVKWNTISEVSSFGVSGTDTIFLTNEYFLRITNTDATNGFISLPITIPNGTEFNIIAHGNGEQIGNINIIVGNGDILNTFYTSSLVSSYTIAVNTAYTFKRFISESSGCYYLLTNKTRLND